MSSTTYKPGSLSRLLNSESALHATSTQHDKQTRLQAVFSEPRKCQAATSVQVSKEKGVSQSLKVLDVTKTGQDIGHPKKKKSKNSDLSLLNKRLRDADAESSHKQKKTTCASVADTVADKESSGNTEKRSQKEINAENALKRIEYKSKGRPQVSRDVLRETRTVFVGNVALSVTKKMLLRLFKTCGKVEAVRLRSVPVADLKLPKKASVILKQFHPSRRTTNAYIVFETADAAEKALSLNGTELESLHIRVDKALANKKHDHKKSVFVGNLPFDAEEEALRQHFAVCGDVFSVRIIRDSKTGVGKGFGYITFTDSSSVSLALALNNQLLNGRALRIQLSLENPKPDNQTDRKVARTPNRRLHQKTTSQTVEEQSGQRVKKDKSNKKQTGKAASHKRHKELKKKNTKKKALAKKKSSLGQLLTKNRTVDKGQ